MRKWFWILSGGDRGARTPNPGDANAVLSQLSYIPTGPYVSYAPHPRSVNFLSPFPTRSALPEHTTRPKLGKDGERAR